MEMNKNRAGRNPAQSPPPYKAYNRSNFHQIPQLVALDKEQIHEIEIVSRVFPFKANNYVVNELIDWENVPHDPIFRLTFPQRGMLREEHFQKLESAISSGAGREALERLVDRIRRQLNPHPAGQMEYNVPILDGEKLSGIQHKYRETVLFFPRQGQTCHAYCTFCFRWPQFVGNRDWKFAMGDANRLRDYLVAHPEVSDVIFTGGDPMIMSPKRFSVYVEALLSKGLEHVQNIRIGTKSLSYWPYKFTTEPEAGAILRQFEQIVKSGKHLALMAHFSHVCELETQAVQEAIRRIRATGAEIRTQSPVLRHINDDAETWTEMWKEQVRQGCVPYYMFVVRDTGAQHYFGVPLVRAWKMFSQAYRQVSGIARTVRGPSMSCTPGKVQISGVAQAAGQKMLVLNMIQGRNPDWVNRPFFAEYDPEALWLDDLKPAFGEERFFFEDELAEILLQKKRRYEKHFLRKTHKSLQQIPEEK